MKNSKQILVMCLMALAVNTTYGCELTPKQTIKEPIIAEAKLSGTDERHSNNTVKIALLLDTSNSMDGLINQAKSQLWDIVNKFTHAKCGNDSRPNLHLPVWQ